MTIFEHCFVVKTTVHAHLKDILRVIAEGLHRTWSLPEFGENDNSAAGGSSGTSSDGEVPAALARLQATAVLSIELAPYFHYIINYLHLFTNSLVSAIASSCFVFPPVSYCIYFILVGLQYSFAPFFTTFS